MDDYENFNKVYSNLPLKIRKEIILNIEEYGPVTWDVAYREIVTNKTKLGTIILKKLKDLKII